MHNFKELKVWQLAMSISKEVFIATRLFPSEEKFTLISQMMRSAISIPSNIAEGCGRNSDKHFLHFLDISLASLHELQYCILLSYDLSYIPKEIYDSTNNKLAEVKAKLINLIKSIRKN